MSEELIKAINEELKAIRKLNRALAAETTAIGRMIKHHQTAHKEAIDIFKGHDARIKALEAQFQQMMKFQMMLLEALKEKHKLEFPDEMNHILKVVK